MVWIYSIDIIDNPWRNDLLLQQLCVLMSSQHLRRSSCQTISCKCHGRNRSTMSKFGQFLKATKRPSKPKKTSTPLRLFLQLWGLATWNLSHGRSTFCSARSWQGIYTPSIAIGGKSGINWPQSSWAHCACTTVKDANVPLGFVLVRDVVCLAAMDTIPMSTTLAEKSTSDVKSELASAAKADVHGSVQRDGAVWKTSSSHNRW